MRVVINTCFGGFGISDEAAEWLINERGWTLTYYTPKGNLFNPDADFVVNTEHISMMGLYSLARWRRHENELRCRPDLIDCIKTLGTKVNTRFSELKVVTIPNSIEWQIEEYDGIEHIAEKHRTWE